jgi:hypothetical protein
MEMSDRKKEERGNVIERVMFCKPGTPLLVLRVNTLCTLVCCKDRLLICSSPIVSFLFRLLLR